MKLLIVFGELDQTVVGVPIWGIALVAATVGLLSLEHKLDDVTLDDKLAEVSVALFRGLKPIGASVVRGVGISVSITIRAGFSAISRVFAAIKENVNVEITIKFLIQITPRQALLGIGLLTGAVSIGVFWSSLVAI